ncbi:haloacid dehalogenase type II [Nonlabens ulvanivorans]|uniref:haloacid dehalogenase type II n=1 Tax=Nonlabens ulvanivorans TaxID=906888 RepID=UPI00328605CB
MQKHKPSRPKVVFFDVNETLLDLAPMKTEIATVLGEEKEVLALWFTTMLQYALVTSASGQYKSFGEIGAAALQMVVANQNSFISEADALKIVSESMQNLPPHPEVKAALALLKEEGYTLVALTNSSVESLKNKFENVGLTSYFDALLSIESVGKFKPFSETYHWAAQEMKVKNEDCMLVAAHGWDVAGALWAGWRAAFVSRPGQQKFPLAPDTEITGSDLSKIAEALIQY